MCHCVGHPRVYVAILVLEQNTNTQPPRYLLRSPPTKKKIIIKKKNLMLRFGVDMLWNPKHTHNNHFV